MNAFYVENIPDRFKRLGKLVYLTKGSMSVVYRIEGKKQEYVLKIIPCGENESKYEAAQKEILIMERLRNCDRVMKLLDSMVTEDGNGKTVYVLEKYELPLAEYMGNKEVSAVDVIEIASDIAEAMLECEKRGVYHLDIQPNNVFINRDGKAFLGDFSSSLLSEELAENKQRRGTLAYMAPEVYVGYACSVQSDIYSLGILLYCMLNNMQVPFVEAKNDERAIYKRLEGVAFPVLDHLDKSLGQEIERIIAKACAFAREDRYVTIEDFKKDLYSILKKIQEKALEDCKFAFDMDAMCGLADMREEDSYDADPFAVSVSIAEFDNPFEKTQPVFMKSSLTCSYCGKELGGGNFCPNCGARILRENQGLRISKVNFSAIAPGAVKKGEYSLINVIMYEEEFRKIVDEIIAKSEGNVQEEKSGVIKATEGLRIRMVLSSPDMTIEDNTEERQWSGEYLNVGYFVLIPKGIAEEQIAFVVTVYMNDVIATRLKFAVKITDNVKQKPEVFREDIMSAFVSFAEQDKNKALRVAQGMQAARSDMDIFLSLNDFRSRKDYTYAAQKEIDSRDVFYLCWSEMAKESEQVDFEWKYAYKEKGPTGIEPLLLDVPSKDSLPRELARKNINYNILTHLNLDGLDITDEKIYIRENLYLNKADYAVYLDGNSIKLTNLQYRLLECLANNMGRVLENETLARYAWEEKYYDGNCDVKRVVSQLNNKIESVCKIRNERKIGYTIDKENL